MPAIGCRRVIRDPNYYKALSQPNVELEWDHIARVVPDGVVLKKSQKHVKLDVIITAIGFKSDATISLPLVGRDGVSMEDYWTAQGGPTAYMGLNMPHFPNMFTLLGPNSSAGHASVVFYEEIQVHSCLLAQVSQHLMNGHLLGRLYDEDDQTDPEEGVENHVRGSVGRDMRRV